MDKLVDKIIEAEPEKQAVLTELLTAGIAMNHRTIKLLASDTITATEIKSQHAALVKRKMGDQTGILITNLESKYKANGADIDPDTGHLAECDCWRCVGARNKRLLENYSNWEN